MTREETKKIIKVIQEYVDGGDIECKDKDLDIWFDVDFPLRRWNSKKRDYRIKNNFIKVDE